MPQALQLGIPLDQRCRPGTLDPDTALAQDAKRLQRGCDAFHDLRIAGLDLEPALDELADLIRQHDGARLRDGLQSGADVGGEAVHVVLVEVHVEQTVVNGDADIEWVGRRITA